ncbi:ANTAR domain-containing protein [Nakamurella antarctica]|uniref:ANTAR domain-containing protein n=1 Tax=Nakamurella antarctica TaxID=1902245 RepID=A0A3G8ZJ27_9ACTN|nr:GAF and ANTAR domain-containing protein [Nakamurella antarctica]AZI57208.1 ANTAR domain-containing protein [Nakamurella antarctica]
MPDAISGETPPGDSGPGPSHFVSSNVPDTSTPSTAAAASTESAVATRRAQDFGLATEVEALGQLPVDQMTLRDLLVQVATFAVRVIPGADGAGLTLSEAGLPDVIIKTTDFVEPIDTIQYGLGQGPCISAAAANTVMRSGSLRTDVRWPEFGPQAAALGVHSVLSLPLITDGKSLGAMNVYAHAPDSFDARAEMLGMSFAVPAAVTVRHAQILAQALRSAEHLQTAADAHACVAQAVGILRKRHRLSSEEGHSELARLAASASVELVDAARTVVEDAGQLPSAS